MTIRKKFNMAQGGLIYGIALTGLVGCSSLSSMLEPDKVDYKSAGKAPTLEVPPDLTQLQRDNRYAIPETNRGTATASGYNLQQTARPNPTQTAAVIAPMKVGDVRVERNGNQRWLVVKQTPEALWPQIKDFWQESGFLINVEMPDAGIMETDWAENRAKIPQDIIRSTLGKVLDSLYSTGERDKFRTRLERAADGTTEIYISHRGAEEVLVGQTKDNTSWTGRAADPGLEAQFLARLMGRLGVEGESAKAAVADAVAQPARAKLVKGASGNYVEIDEEFARAWRRVGLALDRAGFTVEDRDRNQGVYFVRYISQDLDVQTKSGEKGFIAKLFSFGSSDKEKEAQRYRVSVKSASTSSQVAVLSSDGRPETSAIGERILSLLSEQLK